MLEQTWEYRYLFKILISVLLAIYPEVGLLDHMVIFNFWGGNCHAVFHLCRTILHPHQQCTGVPIYISVLFQLCSFNIVVFNKFIYLFIFWLRWVFVAARGLFLVAVSGGCSLLRCAGFSLRWLLLLRNTGSRHVGFGSCGTWTQ